MKSCWVAQNHWKTMTMTHNLPILRHLWTMKKMMVFHVKNHQLTRRYIVFHCWRWVAHRQYMHHGSSGRLMISRGDHFTAKWLCFHIAVPHYYRNAVSLVESLSVSQFRQVSLCFCSMFACIPCHLSIFSPMYGIVFLCTNKSMLAQRIQTWFSNWFVWK